MFFIIYLIQLNISKIQDNFHVFFRSEELLDIFQRSRGQARFCNLVGPTGWTGMITSINWRDLWRYGINPPPTDETQVPALLRQAVGCDFSFELLNGAHWVCRELVAEAYGSGRAFIAGDAAHQNTPAGGFGMNTGMGDAVDLAWKLWGTLNAWGGMELLASYQAERQPVAQRNAQQATKNWGNFRLKVGNAIDKDTPEAAEQRAACKQALLNADVIRQYETDGIALGYRYDPSTIVISDRTNAPSDDSREYVPTSRPGHRAPHAWVDDAQGSRVRRRSTLDLFGEGFTLLSFGAEAADLEALMSAAHFRGVPITHTAIDDRRIADLYERKLVIVRPDGHVAWRGDKPPREASAIIDSMRGAAVDRHAPERG